jgi:hypothetical protein
VTLKVEGTLDELRRLFLGAAEKELKETAKRAGKKVVKKVVKRTLSAWQRFLKAFKYRRQRKNESNSAYFGARTKAASKAYKKEQRKKKGSTKKGQVRKTARRAYER